MTGCQGPQCFDYLHKYFLSGRCKCPAGLSGKLCDVIEWKNSRDVMMEEDKTGCPIQPCLNGGTCLETGVCSCKIGTRGKFCQDIDPMIEREKFVLKFFLSCLSNDIRVVGICDIEIEQKIYSQKKQNGTKLSVDKKVELNFN